jgi:hypothetical protein
MPAPYSPPWMRRGGYAHRDIRVSDAERTEVADRLSKHYSDGRLDQAEFDERVDQAMRAKTQSDLSGLFDDLPDPEETEPSGPQRSARLAPRRRDDRHRPFLLYVLVIVVAAFLVTRTINQFYVPWQLIGVIVLLGLVFAPWHHHHHRS